MARHEGRVVFVRYALPGERVRAALLPDVMSVLAQDLALAVPMVLRPDFAEGVRAQLVDKDRNPSWRPARLEDVDPTEVAALFDDL